MGVQNKRGSAKQARECKTSEGVQNKRECKTSEGVQNKRGFLSKFI